MTQEESVPIEELQALVKHQKSRADQYSTFTDEHMKGLAKGYKQCADQLQAVIEDYE